MQQAGRQRSLNARPKPRKGGYAIDFWGLGYDLAERKNLRSEIEGVGYHVRELQVVGDRGGRLAGFGTRVFSELSGDRYVTLARSDLSRLLLGKAAAVADIIFDDEVTALTQELDGVSIVLRDGVTRRFDLVVGTDGLHSQLRRLVFGPSPRFEKRLGYAVAAFETVDYQPRRSDIYVMHGKPGRMLGRFTMRDDRSLFLFVFAFEDALPTTLDEQRMLLISLYRGDGWKTEGILQRLKVTEELYLDHLSQIVMPIWSNGRVVLIGDAAFCPSLLAGQGSALGIVAAYVLAGELTCTPDRIGDALAAYERLLRPYIATKQAGVLRFARAFAPQTHFGLWFRNFVIRCMAIPGLAKYAVGREITDRLSLPDYPFRSSPVSAAGQASDAR